MLASQELTSRPWNGVRGGSVPGDPAPGGSEPGESEPDPGGLDPGGPALAGPWPADPGPDLAQPWAAARPSGPVRVRHQREPGLLASAAARSRQTSASRAPRPAASPGSVVKPSQVVRGMVRFTEPHRPAG